MGAVSQQIETLKEEMLESVKVYFQQTGEQIDDDFVLLLIESLVDEYKAKRNYPDYFTEEQIEADVAAYFKRKKTYFAMKVIPAMVGKIGAEGQVNHSENGISRTWETDGWFDDVIPYCEVL
ncbi:MAG: hypothetical protein Q4F83_11190 [Eubacteriales bacterium]|nr:hypothetical protein [Eubacteriales bacterium]